MSVERGDVDETTATPRVRRRRSTRVEARRTVRTRSAAPLDYARLPMDTRGLIDALVHQTTILLAQLATAAGIRAPLAHVADEVFLSLATELEQQGVRKKVAADMFGLALRRDGVFARDVERTAPFVAPSATNGAAAASAFSRVRAVNTTRWPRPASCRTHSAPCLGMHP